MLLKIAFRNIFRHKRRSFLTALAMFGGFILASFFIGMADGTYNQVIDIFTRTNLGHIQIHGDGYLDKPSLYNTIDDYEAIGEKAAGIEGVEAWTPRILSGGLVSVGDKTYGASIRGIDPAKEDGAMNFSGKLVEGELIANEAGSGVLLGKGLAKILKTGVGDSVVIVSQAADGSIANDIYPIKGFVELGDDMSDRTTMFMNLVDAQELFVLQGRVHEIVILVENIKGVRPISGRIKETLNREELDVEPWQEFAKSFYQAMQADKQGNYITQFIIMLIVAVGVLNTVLMSVLERTREYGVMKAIGTKPVHIFFLIILEVLLLASVSMVIGSGMGMLVNYLFARAEISMPGGMQFDIGGMEIKHWTAEITASSVYFPAITVFLSALLVSIFPALRAAKTSPAKTMRAF